MLRVQEIIDMTEGTLLQGDPQAKITYAHFHSNQMEQQSLFIALSGGVRDGHDFLEDAFEKGADAALVSNDQSSYEIDQSKSIILVPDTEKAFQQLAASYRKKLDVPIVAITGSNGKTTTKDMAAHLLAKKFHVFKTHKNLNNHLGVPLSILNIQADHDFAVLELGMNHAGEIDALGNIVKPTISILTNIGDAHIEYFGSQEKIAEAKGELLPHTDPTGYVLLNADDERVMSLKSKYVGHICTYSITKRADVYATDIAFTEEGTFFNLHILDKQTSCFMPMLGQHNVANVLPCAFVAYHSGCSLTEIADQLLSLKISAMRFEILNGPQGSLFINDAYNASPVSMKKALETFIHLYPARKKIAVLGDMFELGSQSEQFHADIGQYALEKELTVITHGQHAEHISVHAKGKHAHTEEEAIKLLQPYLNSDYVLLFKASRGMHFDKLIEKLLEC